jgi:mRNA-degrading endonuclease RelE of RelBE toxin-antitoxin system
MKTVVFSTLAARQFDGLPKTARIAIAKAPGRYSIEGRGDVKALAGRPAFRLRVGEYRVILSEDRTTILAITIGRRSSTTYS